MTDTRWSGIELRARREALGLNQQQLAGLLQVSQSILSQWETGARSPKDPHDVRESLEALEAWVDDIFNCLCDLVDAVSETMADRPLEVTEVSIRTYKTDAAYWEADERAREHKLPATLHRVAAAQTQKIMREEETAIVHLVE